ncbi:MAG: hypothetical protein RLZZ396_1652 [Planctomycetota bacterium]|jgi:hypothetical protein
MVQRVTQNTNRHKKANLACLVLDSRGIGNPKVADKFSGDGQVAAYLLARLTTRMDLASYGFVRQANLNESEEKPGFNENSEEFDLAHPSYFAQIVDIHLDGNYS